MTEKSCFYFLEKIIYNPKNVKMTKYQYKTDQND